jgi:predicted esterase YcpF (UPF0227 family)
MLNEVGLTSRVNQVQKAIFDERLTALKDSSLDSYGATRYPGLMKPIFYLGLLSFIFNPQFAPASPLSDEFYNRENQGYQSPVTIFFNELVAKCVVEIKKTARSKIIESEIQGNAAVFARTANGLVCKCNAEVSRSAFCH